MTEEVQNQQIKTAQEAQQNDISSNQGQNQSSQGDSDDSKETELNALRSELEANQKELKKMMEISARALADLQNYRRRAEEEKSAFISHANTNLIQKMLPALNSIDLALKHEPKDLNWIPGAETAMKQITETLAAQGLTTIPTTGQIFNPKFHEALMTVAGAKDQVITELEKGYMLGDRVIKQARVTVGTDETPTAA